MLHEPYNRLKGLLRERGMTYDSISKALGISKASFCRKVNGSSDFYLSEVGKLEEQGFSRDIFFPKSFEYNNKAKTA